MDKDIEVKVEELNKENRDLREKVQKQENVIYELQYINNDLKSTNQKLLDILDNFSKGLARK